MKSLKLLRPRDKAGSGLFLATRTIAKAENTTDRFYRLTPEGFVEGDGSSPAFDNHLPDGRSQVISLLEADRIFDVDTGTKIGVVTSNIRKELGREYSVINPGQGRAYGTESGRVFAVKHHFTPLTLLIDAQAGEPISTGSYVVIRVRAKGAQKDGRPALQLIYYVDEKGLKIHPASLLPADVDAHLLDAAEKVTQKHSVFGADPRESETLLATVKERTYVVYLDELIKANGVTAHYPTEALVLGVERSVAHRYAAVACGVAAMFAGAAVGASYLYLEHANQRLKQAKSKLANEKESLANDLAQRSIPLARSVALPHRDYLKAAISLYHPRGLVELAADGDGAQLCLMTQANRSVRPVPVDRTFNRFNVDPAAIEADLAIDAPAGFVQQKTYSKSDRSGYAKTFYTPHRSELFRYLVYDGSSAGNSAFSSAAGSCPKAGA
jgi:hypothetical protein